MKRLPCAGRLAWATIALLAVSPLAFGADCNGNDVDDADDLLAGASEDCNENGIPDECEGLPVQMSLGKEVVGVAALPRIVESVDLDRDGDLDLIQLSRNAGASVVTVLLGSGDRSFTPASETSLEGLAYSMAIDDLNGDGHLDVATANSGFILVLLGKGDNTFAKPVRLDLRHRAPQETRKLPRMGC